MVKNTVWTAVAAACWLSAVWCHAAGAPPLEIVRYKDETSTAALQLVKSGERFALAVGFVGTSDLHYYAEPDTAPTGMALSVSARANGVVFGKAVFPPAGRFYDKAMQKDVPVYVGDFTVLVPIDSAPTEPFDAEVTIEGIACTSQVCLPPFEHKLQGRFNPAEAKAADLTAPGLGPATTVQGSPTRDPSYPARVSLYVRLSGGSAGTPLAMMVALLAGLSINIMPCVLPILPLIIMRLVEQSRQSARNRLILGGAFCGGIILFFVAFAVLAAVLKLVTGVAIDWGDHLRYPGVATALFLITVAMGLFLFDVFGIRLPGSLAGPQSGGTGIFGSVGMGFFAAILSTPCSGAYFALVLVWAQTQPLSVGIAAISMMGVGMALPYALLVLVPGLLAKVPRPGPWMDVFRKAMGFVLLYLAVKLALPALPKDRLLDAVKYAVILAFALWMWGGWVTFSTPFARKWAIRGAAVLIAIGAGVWLLPAPAEPAGAHVEWQDYDRDRVNDAVAAGRPVVIKFTADWCTNCKVVERTVYRQPDVADLVKRKGVLAMLGDTTQKSYPATTDLKEIYGIPGSVPTTIVITPDGTQHQLVGIFDKKRLTDILDDLADKEQ